MESKAEDADMGPASVNGAHAQPHDQNSSDGSGGGGGTAGGEGVAMSVDGPARAKEEDDRQRYELVYTLLGHQRSVSAIAISPDGTMLASCGADGLIKLWSLATGALRATLRAPATTSLGGPEGMEDAKGGAGGGVGVASGLSDVAWSSDGRYIVSGGDDRMVRVWDAVRVSASLASFSSSPPRFSCRSSLKLTRKQTARPGSPV